MGDIIYGRPLTYIYRGIYFPIKTYIRGIFFMFFIARGGGNFLSQNGFYFDIKHGHAILNIIFVENFLKNQHICIQENHFLFA